MVHLPSSAKRLFATKAIEAFLEPNHQQYGSPMKRDLTAKDAFMIGIGGAIGSGIFVVAGNAAAKYAGPAVTLSFVITGVTCAFVGLCYSELVTCIPAVGSVYSFACVTFGEAIAFTAGWIVIGQYFAGAALAALSWSSHVCKLATLISGVKAGVTFTKSPVSFSDAMGFFRNESNGIINLPAMTAVFLCTYAMCFGVRYSAGISQALIGAALVVLSVVLVVIATGYTKYPDWSPFFPAADGDGGYGFRGVFQAATAVFFVYLGIDSVANCVQEVKRPARDMPIGIMGSLCFSTIVYILVLGGILGVTPFKTLNTLTPLADASDDVFRALAWFVSMAGMTGAASAMIVSFIALSRVLFAMAADGLLPPIFAQLHRKHGTPLIPTLISGSIVAVMAGLLPIDLLGDLASTGTLFTFAIVSLSAGILRFSRPDLERPFKMPLGPVFIPTLGFVCSMGLLIFAGWANVLRLVIWVAFGLVVYFRYSVGHSLLRLCAPIDHGGIAMACDGKAVPAKTDDRSTGAARAYDDK